MPETVRAVQIAMGEATAGDQVEQALSQIASGLRRWCASFDCSGGETWGLRQGAGHPHASHRSADRSRRSLALRRARQPYGSR